MGCTSSKVDELPAVSLCRERLNFLDEAMKQRYAFSQSHIAYLHSLKSLGRSLHSFLSNDSLVVVNSPRLGIPAPRKDADAKEDNESGHIQFHSDSDDDNEENEDHDEEEDEDFDHHDHGHDLMSNHGHGEIRFSGLNYGDNVHQVGSFSNFGNTGYVHMNYMKSSKTKPSVVYEQRPMSPQTYRVGEGEASSSSYNNPYPNSNQQSYPFYGYSNYGYYGNSSGMGAGAPAPAQAESSKPPPPPPSPPRASAWDFLNFFDSGNDRYYAAYTPSRDSKELREEEGIPELEDESEVVKEVHGDQKFVGGRNSNSKAPVEEVGKGEEGETSVYRGRVRSSLESDGDEYEVHVVDKKVVDGEGRDEDLSKGMRDVSDVAREIEFLFQRASESGNEIAKILEVGRAPYNRNHASRMLHVASPSLSMVSSQPSTSTSADTASSTTGTSGPAYLEIEQDLALRAKNFSSTLQKLYLWEKKLYNEVKAEEKMRVIHDRKRHKLKRLDEKGAEAHKVDSARDSVRSLSTKMRIAIQVVDKISATINKMRDEELWPQLNDLIKGLSKMYKCMLECHRAQCQAIKEARSFCTLGSGKKLSDDHLDATLQLEHELINWTARFSSWVSAQKGYVRSLNNWLLKCLLYEPEETADGIAPFSPGRIGAPPIFVICNQWSEAINGISEKEVLESMRLFANGVLQMWEQDKQEMRQRSIADKDYEKKVKFLDREDQKLQKEIQALDKKIVLASGDGYTLSMPVYQSDTSTANVQASLLRIFDAMERFTAESTKAYDDLIQRSEEEALRPRE